MRRSLAVKDHEFTLILSTDPDEAQANRLYGIISDGTISTAAGVPQIHFHRASPSLEGAIRSAIGDVRSAGFDVRRVAMEPEAVTQSA
jgi:hypothetical protein